MCIASVDVFLFSRNKNQEAKCLKANNETLMVLLKSLHQCRKFFLGFSYLFKRTILLYLKILPYSYVYPEKSEKPSLV